MKSHEARIAEAVASLTHRLEGWGVDEAAPKAHEFIRDMLHNGWRTTRATLDLPPKIARPADETTQANALGHVRAQLALTKAGLCGHGVPLRNCAECETETRED